MSNRSTRSLRFFGLAGALCFAAAILATGAAAAAGPAGEMTWGVHVSLAPTWFDPAEAPGIITPFMIFYALHDAMVKPMPGHPLAPSLAESWTASPDGLAYDLVLRKGVTFHNGAPVTADDVKFSFERYRGAAATTLKTRVASVDVIDARHVRFRLKEPWPDFMTFYGTPATGAGWIVPKKYVQAVGDDGFKKAPIGAGPYRFVSFTPGVELVLEAYEHYWRKVPTVKRLVFKVIPDEATRLAALKRGEVDIVYSIRGELAEELRRTSGLILKPTVIPAPFWLVFLDQWDPKSPWHDQRVRLAANYSINRDAINRAETLGYSKIAASIIPSSFDFFWQPPLYPVDPGKARQLLAAAGYPNGFDAGHYYCDSSYSNLAEGVVNYLSAVGIHVGIVPLERAAFFAQYREKKLKNVVQVGSGAFGNAATRIEAFVAAGGAYVYQSYPDIDGLFREQAAETDRHRREATLQKVQQLMYEKAMFAPIWELGFLNGVGPRVSESGLGLITGHAYSAPYEDLTLKPR
jgi:peptide/nickel transport system substrate-binding protein